MLFFRGMGNSIIDKRQRLLYYTIYDAKQEQYQRAIHANVKGCFTIIVAFAGVAE